MSGTDTDGATVALDPPAATPSPPAAGSPVSLEVGRVLRNRYVIEERLGSGGRGTVFRVLDRYRSSLPHAERYVALKVLHTGRECSEETLGNLQRELHYGQLLSQQNIVNVFDLDRDGDVVFFTMELLEGELLSEVLGRLRPAAMQRSQALQIIRQLGAGLEHAHERGVVHGDLKPRNLFVTREGRLRILDFGAAQAVARTAADAPASLSGTPAYASCEMLEGRAADPCDDLYALACICYELLSGTHPFASRPATVARDFGVKALRPAGLTGRQWRALRAGLSWHRAGRSMSVHTFIRRLTDPAARKPSVTPLADLAATGTARPWLHSSRAVAASIAALVVAVLCMAQLRATSTGKSPARFAAGAAQSLATPAAPAAPAPTGASATVSQSPSTDASQAPFADAAARSAGPKLAGSVTSQVKATPRRTTPAISVDGYHVSNGEHFVEIRVHRDGLQKNASFQWWTEPATAKQDVDYVQQAKAIQTFAPAQHATRFYVKLLPESGRSQRDYFYVAIAQPQPGHPPDYQTVKRVQIWLPTLPASRDHLQASR